jgi:hypothetical protein
MRSISRAALALSFAVLPLSAQLFKETTDISVPLTVQEKAVRTLRLQPALAAGGLFSAGLSQLVDNPHEWGQGGKGYGKRLISSYGQSAIGSALGFGLDSALRTDPRYDPCECKAVKPRIGHALLRLVWGRRDNGGEIVNFSSLGSAFGAAAIANQWRPDRQHTPGYVIGSASTSLAVNGGLNIVREFWPEISKKVPFLK